MTHLLENTTNPRNCLQTTHITFETEIPPEVVVLLDSIAWLRKGDPAQRKANKAIYIISTWTFDRTREIFKNRPTKRPFVRNVQPVGNVTRMDFIESGRR